MATFRGNVIANFIGGIWIALMGFAFVPIYISELGIEGFGLIGVYGTITAICYTLDLGLSDTLSRELAFLTGRRASPKEIGDLFRSFEIPYWLIAIVIGIAIAACSQLVSSHWVQSSMQPREIQKVVVIIAATIALQWPRSIYAGGLIGLQQQVLLNNIEVIAATARGLGAVLVLKYISATVEAFFYWQAIVSLSHTLALRQSIWTRLRSGEGPPSFRPELVFDKLTFAISMLGITTTFTLISQIDKVVLVKLLPLKEFGYYSLASLLAVNIYRFMTPVFAAAFPRLTEAAASGETSQVQTTYHNSCQLVSVLTLSVAAFVACFSYQMLALWTSDPVTAEHTHLLLSLLVLGCALNALKNIPYALQLAYGKTRITLLSNLTMLSIQIPATVVASQKYGALGAASVWLTINLVYVVLFTAITHMRLLRGDFVRWCLQDVALPLLLSASVAVAAKMLIPFPESTLGGLCFVASGALLSIACAALATPFTRIEIIRIALRAQTRIALRLKP